MNDRNSLTMSEAMQRSDAVPSHRGLLSSLLRGDPQRSALILERLGDQEGKLQALARR